MEQNNLLQELETLFNSFTGESLNEIKDYNRLHIKLERGLTAYLNFIDTTYPLKGIASSIFAKNLTSLSISNVNNLYQNRILGNRKQLGTIDIFSRNVPGISQFHQLLVNEVKKNGIDGIEILTKELNSLKEEKERMSRPLVFKDDVFTYKGVALEIVVGTFLYDILTIVYLTFDGGRGEISYKELIKKLRNLKRFKDKDDAYILKRIQSYLMSKSEGLRSKIKLKKGESFELITLIHGFGIRYNNK